MSNVITWGGRIGTGNVNYGRARRSFYRSERAPARKQGVLSNEPPAQVPDANGEEITSGIWVVAKQLGVKVGQGVGYDKQRDEYVAVGKSGRWHKAQDWRIPGYLVSAVILAWRRVLREAGPADPRAYLHRQGVTKPTPLLSFGGPRPSSSPRPRPSLVDSRGRAL